MDTMGKNLLEKREAGWENIYGKEIEKYYNRNEWGIYVIGCIVREERNLTKELEERERHKSKVRRKR